MILEAAIVGLAIVIAALSRGIWHVRPRKAFCQITVVGVTDVDGEQFHLTGTLFEDESEERRNQKVNEICEIRSNRLRAINEKMIQIQAQAKEEFKNIQAKRLEEHKSNVSDIKKS